MLKSKDLLRSFLVYNNFASNISTVSLRANLCTETTKDLELKCWKCSKSLSPKKLFCQYCSSVQKPNPWDNYYDLFDLKLNYLINSGDLSKKFKQLQSQLHPDKFSNKDEEEQSISETYSSYLNKAYSILQNPLERGLYLLSLQNITIDEDSKGTDQKLLMEILMLNEELDDASTADELKSLAAKIRTTLDELTKKINSSFEQKDFNLAKEYLIRMKYFTTLDTKIREKRNLLELAKHSS
uniref:Iron-sulfur cluster co-chaperone protein HscB, mitochondrial n=1 Tax=Cacopsylla melanoneura TaxID=428564 RepID=A0A8D8YSU8_9HEMI